MNPAQAVDHPTGPLKVFSPTLEGPVDRRCKPDIAKVANLVGQLDKLRPGCQMRGVLDLQPLAVRLWPRLVVSDFDHDRGDLLAKEPAQLLCRRVGILHRIVQEGSGNGRNIIYASLAYKDACEFYGVIDVRRGVGILSTLVAMFFRCERDSGNQN